MRMGDDRSTSAEASPESGESAAFGSDDEIDESKSGVVGESNGDGGRRPAFARGGTGSDFAGGASNNTVSHSTDSCIAASVAGIGGASKRGIGGASDRGMGGGSERGMGATSERGITGGGEITGGELHGAEFTGGELDKGALNELTGSGSDFTGIFGA